MSASSNLPKSLHTVTVLVAVARELRTMGVDDPITTALAVLGYAGSPDSYGLADKARAILAKGVRL